MTAIKLQRFLGTAPKNASELLPDNGAQIARNLKTYSGDLIPYPEPVVAADLEQTGVLRTLYGIRDPDTDDLVFMAWPTAVDVATPAVDDFETRKFYYTGDGAPKVSTYELATTGAKPYPVAAYDLGLPLPTQQPTATPTSFTPASTATVARDNSGNVTVTTSSAHNLKDGALIRVFGFTSIAGTYAISAGVLTVTITAHGLTVGDTVFLRLTSGAILSNEFTILTTPTADTFTCSLPSVSPTTGNVELDLSSFNVTTEAVVVNATTLRYFSAGFSLATRAITSGKIDLGGQIQARSYVYTWFTPWLEESVNSEPSDAIFIKEGQVVTLTNLPTAPPAGNNFIRGIRVYRTLSGTTDADFFRLSTLWFPNTITNTQRASDVSTVTFQYPHNLIPGDRFKLDGATDSSFDGDFDVASVVDIYTITFDQVGQPDAASAASVGTLYYDVAESLANPARYWGFSGVYSFTDDFNFRSVTGVLPSRDYDPPPADLQGLTLVQNNILAGFVGNDVYFSEPGQFHAWPAIYKRSFDSTVVAIVPASGNIVVLTEDYPYVVSGNDPNVFLQTKLTGRYPCVSRQSVAFTNFGPMYATHDGLVLISAATPALFTRVFHSSETWNEALDPTTIVGAAYRERYFASHNDGSQRQGSIVVEELADQRRLSIVDCDVSFTAAWYDSIDNSLYLIIDDTGNVYKWDDEAQPEQALRWKSKTLTPREYTNLGAARVIADYPGTPPSPPWEQAEDEWQLADTLWNATDPVTFKLYKDKTLYFTTTCSSSNIFRLPTGYKTDTMSVEVESSVRVRAIHLGATPISLRGV